MKITVIKKTNGKVVTLNACPWLIGHAPTPDSKN